MIGLVGISHKTAPAEIREQVVMNEKEVIEFILSLKSQKDFTGIVILSTCNRTEIYFNQAKNCKASKFSYIISKLFEFKNVRDAEISKYFYIYGGEKSVKHLFRVASGMDSLVIGEDQILGQVKNAYRISVDNSFTGPVLNRLFHMSFETGKKVRTKTAIGKGISSVSYAAVELAEKKFKTLGSSSALLVGAGETAELALEGLIRKQIRETCVANRTLENAEKLAKKYNTRFMEFEKLNGSLHKFDIIIASTSSQQTIIKTEDVQDAMQKRGESPLCFFDLSMPRNIDDDVRKIKNVTLYTIDDLKEIVSRSFEKRKGEIEKAEKLIGEASSEYFEWISTLKLIPTIELLKEKFNQVVDNRLSFVKNKVTENEFKIIANSSNYLRDKYVRLIVRNLKELSGNGKKPEYIDMINNLLELTKTDKN